MMRCLALLVLVCLPANAVERGSAAELAAQNAVADLRASSALPSKCETAFQAFWRVYTGPGEKGLVHAPAEPDVGSYFGYGSLVSEPLLAEAQQVCADETNARGDLVVRVLKERENRKWRRARQLQHAERLIGY